MHPTLDYKPLTDEELDLLEAFIFSEAVSEDSLDLIGIHGFLCALNISPVSVDTTEWLELLFDGEPNWQSSEQATLITNLLLRWKDAICSDLYNDRELGMPCELTLITDNEESELEIWAQAFMEGVFMREDEWFGEGSDKEEAIAELMLPIMVASNLFEEKEFTEIRKNRVISEQMANEIPEILVDLYLLFHAPAN
ncbi:YecA family protein [Neptunomonas concharum]|uniref:YecA family protein n=1 Tax=Neptunomonas concharum TaxID=1031538 RepID=A0A5P1RAB5_9GAMM|nr:YecA family protein [Neptunomonas concharum]QEQ96226.1 YecA family protein [Neptunomonas concharum]